MSLTFELALDIAGRYFGGAIGFTNALLDMVVLVLVSIVVLVFLCVCSVAPMVSRAAGRLIRRTSLRVPWGEGGGIGSCARGLGFCRKWPIGLCGHLTTFCMSVAISYISAITSHGVVEHEVSIEHFHTSICSSCVFKEDIRMFTGLIDIPCFISMCCSINEVLSFGV